MSRGSMRFWGLARVAVVEAALQPVAEGDDGVGRDMARCTLASERQGRAAAPFFIGIPGRLTDRWA